MLRLLIINICNNLGVLTFELKLLKVSFYYQGDHIWVLSIFKRLKFVLSLNNNIRMLFY